MSHEEEELLRILGLHDELVARCARGEMSYSAFEKAYDSFYPRYPLDGSKAHAEQLRLLAKHAPRVALHREIWEEVITKVTADAYLDEEPTLHRRGFIGADEAIVRLGELFVRHRVSRS